MSPIPVPRPVLVVVALSLAALILPPSARAADVPFLRGDVDGDGRLLLTDAVAILRHLFATEVRPSVTCESAADLNDDGSLNVTDPIHLLNHLFRGGPQPAAPYPDCGEDPTPDALGCARHVHCHPGFYGLPVDTDGAIFVLDVSGSMQDAGELLIAKREMARNIDGFAEGSQFGIVVFSGTFEEFPAGGTPAAATPEAKDAALAFISAIAWGDGNCPRAALLAALQMAGASTARAPALYLVSDGLGTCEGADERTYLEATRAAVDAANGGNIPIHTVGVLDVSRNGEAFLRGLAEDSGGTYVRIVR